MCPNLSASFAFLFGSGVSIPSGMPSVSAITERVLSGTGVMRHSNGNFYFGEPLYAHVGLQDEYVPRVVSFLNRLKIEVESYYQFENDRLRSASRNLIF